MLLSTQIRLVFQPFPELCHSFFVARSYQKHHPCYKTIPSCAVIGANTEDSITDGTVDIGSHSVASVRSTVCVYAVARESTKATKGCLLESFGQRLCIIVTQISSLK